MRSTGISIGPSSTPKIIKILLLITAFASLFWGICVWYFPKFAFEILQYGFGLTLSGVKKGFVWEFVSFFFVQPAYYRLSFAYLLDLGFRLYLLWVFGSSLIELRGKRSFLTLFFSSGVVTGLFVFAIMALFQIPGPFLGSHTTVFALLIAWMMLNPTTKLLLFFAIPIKVTWLIVGIWGVNLVLDLANADFIHFTAYLISGLFGYFYALFSWKVHSPFPFLHRFEDSLMYLKLRKRKKKDSKIYDFQTGKRMEDDDAFMDAMLHKISEKGKDSLTKKEKNRMNQISKYKKKH